MTSCRRPWVGTPKDTPLARAQTSSSLSGMCTGKCNAPCGCSVLICIAARAGTPQDKLAHAPVLFAWTYFKALHLCHEPVHTLQ